MSLNKAIEHKKEYRKPYYGAKSVSCSCRNHGSCDWCRENRLHKFKTKEPYVEDEYKSTVKFVCKN